MEFIMDILEIIFDIVIEGSNKSGKPVSMFWRVLMLLMVLITYLGLAGGCIFVGYHAVLDNNLLMALVFFGLSIIIVFGGIYEVKKVFKKRKE